MATANLVLVCGQSEYLYNRNVAFNFAAIEVSSDIVAIFDRECDLAPNAMQDIVDSFSEAGTADIFVINQGGSSCDRRHLHFLALRRRDLIIAGGLDESAHYGGALGGPHELARRLKCRHFQLKEIRSVPPAHANNVASGDFQLESLMCELWPEKFSPFRGTPIRSSPEIENLRATLLQ